VGDKMDVGTIVALVISGASLLISGFVLWYNNFRSIKIKIEDEEQVQLVKINNIPAFNLLFVISASGSDTKWKTIKFKSAEVTLPNKKNIVFPCMAHLEEAGMGQRNKSRNVPVSIKGGDSKTVTLAFQRPALLSMDWMIGKYAIEIKYATPDGESYKISKLNFKLNQKSLDCLNGPSATLMKELE